MFPLKTYKELSVRGKIVYWIITSILLIPATLYAILAIVNPFWFRDKMLDNAVPFFDAIMLFRCKLMKPFIIKKMLDIR